jgi:isopenicillin N synthase-like dioxygenase
VVQLSFFYLNQHGLSDAFEGVFDVCEQVFALDDDEKKKYDVGVSGNSFGYVRTSLSGVWVGELFKREAI